MMTVTQIGIALRALCSFRFAVKIDLNNNWYVEAPISIRQGQGLSSPTQHRPTMEDALLEYWKRITNLKPDELLEVTHFGTEDRNWTGRWNGFMWEEVTS